MTIPAPATITTTGVGTQQIEALDLDGDGTEDLVFGVGAAAVTSTVPFAYSGVSSYNGGVVGYIITGTNSSYYYATKLAKGATIGSTSTLVQGDYLNTMEQRYKNKLYGQFKTAGGYVGFSFTEADGVHYGYLSVTSTETGSTNTNIKSTLTFGPGAYNSVAGQAITIPGGAVPEPGSFAALAFGVAGTAGAALYRRKRAAAPVA